MKIIKLVLFAVMLLSLSCASYRQRIQRHVDAIKLKKTIVVSVEQDEWVYDARESENVPTTVFVKPLNLSNLWYDSILKAFNEKYPEKEILFQKSGGDFVIFVKTKIRKTGVSEDVDIYFNPSWSDDEVKKMRNLLCYGDIFTPVGHSKTQLLAVSFGNRSAESIMEKYKEGSFNYSKAEMYKIVKKSLEKY